MESLGTGLRASSQCALLTLPLEIRLQIYELVLAPVGYVQQQMIERQPKKTRSRITPLLDLGLLATCRQIYEESRDIVFKRNVFMLSTNLCLGNRKDNGSDDRFDRQTLSKIENVVIVVGWFHHGKHLDWRFFQAMTSLRNATISIIADYRQRSVYHVKRCNYTLKWLIRCIPAKCSLRLGASSSEEVDYVQQMRQHHLSPNRPIDKTDLEGVSQAYLPEQGRLNGYTMDFRRSRPTASLLNPNYPQCELGTRPLSLVALPHNVRLLILGYLRNLDSHSKTRYEQLLDIPTLHGDKIDSGHYDKVENTYSLRTDLRFDNKER
ncbi:MAG: hypothetical protein M1821_003260 [Bathelium mastoideum]|nr:MAG: hypothetical protein M1821_003260 [Bathelium mastoideum]KAI9689382.1 MAG: hypothetical protein M1822_010033 [Bathelium mastoideum]